MTQKLDIQTVDFTDNQLTFTDVFKIGFTVSLAPCSSSAMGFQPAKACAVAFLLLCTFKPAMATWTTVLLGWVTLQPAMAPEFPWWRCHFWNNRAWMCDANGWCTELSRQDRQVLLDLMDDHAAIEFYVHGQSHMCEAQNSWRVLDRKPTWSDAAMGWMHPGFDHGHRRNEPAMAATL